MLDIRVQLAFHLTASLKVDPPNVLQKRLNDLFYSFLS
jgi:hypothetical protein